MIVGVGVNMACEAGLIRETGNWRRREYCELPYIGHIFLILVINGLYRETY